MPEVLDRLPLRFGIGLGDARVFVNPRDRHVEIERRFARLDGAGDGRGADGSGVQASGICPSPANSPDVGSRPIQPAPGKIHLGPGVQIGEICVGPAGPSSGLTSAASWIR